jgi:hypothetical protein
MKKWKIILAVVLAVCVVTLVPLAVMAQTATTPSPAVRDPLKGGLALVAPRAVKAGQAMQLTVFLRWNQEPVSGVGIWAVSKDKIDAFKQAVQDLRKDTSIQPADKDYATVLELQAVKLGSTNVEGQLDLTFPDAGQMLLVAFKSGYLPDWSPLAVRNGPQALAITAPRQVKLGDPATITVHLKGAQDKIGQAGLWAITLDKAADLKAAVESARAANQTTPGGVDYAAILNAQAISLGDTDGSGQLTYTFESAGRYALVTFKPGYLPGFGALAVVAPEPAATAAPSATP